MAMTLASPSASPSPSTGDATRTTNSTTTTTNVKNESNTTAPVKEDATTPSVPADATTTNASANNAANIKRKPSRRANTAERRATHNAVERQRRETLNGRFLDLAQLLPNLSQIRRPSKSSIVNSSIAHIHASRRHRMLASRELRQLKAEADALRREVNEWRSRQNLPLVDEPVRSDGFNIIISGELDVLVAEMGAEMAAQGHGNLVGVGGSNLMDVEEDEDIDDWGPAPPSSHGGPPPPQAGGYPAGPGGQYDEEVFVPQAPIHHQQQQQQHPVHHPQQGMMMNGHHGHHPQHHPQHPMHHQQHVHHMQQQQQQFGYHPSQGPHPQFAPGSLEDDRHFLKNGGGNPFAHNITATRSYDSPTQGPGAGALFTPPATRDGLPPNGVAGLTSSKGPMNINTNVGGGASPAQSVQSVHSAHSPASHHSGIALNGQVMNGEVGTPPPPSAISQHFSARSGSGSPVGGYELASSNGSQQPPMERRATYPGPGGPPMMYGPTGEMYPGGHPMHEMRGGGHEMRAAHEMRGMEMRQQQQHHGHHPMHGPGGHDMRGHGHDMRGGDMRQHGHMVGAGSGGGGLFGMML